MLLRIQRHGPRQNGEARVVFGNAECSLLQTAVDRAKDRTHLAAEQRKNTDNNNSDEHQNKRILDQALAIFLGEEATYHCNHPLTYVK
jgi:hypothetical protein